MAIVQQMHGNHLFPAGQGLIKINQCQHPVIIGHSAQQPHNHMANTHDRHLAIQTKHAAVLIYQPQARQFQLGQGQAAPFWQIIQRVQKLNKINAAKVCQHRMAGC